MPVNRNALIRYRTIDTCLRNRFRKWTLEDLIDACSEALYEYEGIEKGISKRTIQMDLQMMRSDKLGYNAPIIIQQKKYYSYEDPEYSITNIPLSNQDLNKLTEVVEILKQFRGFSHFQELSGMVQRLEDKVHSAKTKQESVIDFETNDNLKGLEHIDFIYRAIINKHCLEMTYQSFKARTPNTFIFHPYLLKEYRNRWFVLGTTKKNHPIQNLALDRILDIEISDSKFVECPQNDIKSNFKDVIGVTVNHQARAEKIVLFFDHPTAPYVLTKPIHHSQKLLETLPHGVIISLDVQINFELEREILGFGDSVRVIGPESLKRRIKDKFSHAIDLYNTELSISGLNASMQQLQHRGSAVLKHVFTRKEINRIKAAIQEYFKKQEAQPEQKVYAIRQLLLELPELENLLLNQNIQKVISRAGGNFFLSKAIYFDKPPQSNWYVTWHQDTTINVKERIETDGFYGWTKKGNVISVCPPEEILKDTFTIRIHLDDTDEKNGCLKVIPGSHNKRLNDEEIAAIAQNTIAQSCEVEAGGIHLMKPLLLHASSKGINQKHRRVIHLEFNSRVLPHGLQWSEKK
ncbi:MAG: WYL domain-containing protein [Cytophagaceae bacterium]